MIAPCAYREAANVWMVFTNKNFKFFLLAETDRNNWRSFDQENPPDILMISHKDWDMFPPVVDLGRWPWGSLRPEALGSRRVEAG